MLRTVVMLTKQGSRKPTHDFVIADDGTLEVALVDMFQVSWRRSKSFKHFVSYTKCFPLSLRIHSVTVYHR